MLNFRGANLTREAKGLPREAKGLPREAKGLPSYHGYHDASASEGLELTINEHFGKVPKMEESENLVVSCMDSLLM